MTSLFHDPSERRDGRGRDDKLNKKLAALPFVLSRKKGGRCFWSVTPTGDYITDFEQGRSFAVRLLPFLEFNIGPVLLGWIVADMIQAGSTNGVVSGFMIELGTHMSGGTGLQ